MVIHHWSSYLDMEYNLALLDITGPKLKEHKDQNTYLKSIFFRKLSIG